MSCTYSVRYLSHYSCLKSMKKIAIIGAGQSGLTAIKCCKEEDFIPVCFEQSDEHGGLWRYREEDVEGIASVMRTTIINTSKERSAFSDFPPDKSYPNYMHNTQMLDYFTSYALYFDLLKHVRFNTKVIKVDPTRDGRWMISTSSTKTDTVSEEIFDAVMVCSGHHAFPNIPTFPNQHKFKGTILHTHSLKSCDRFKGKIVAVIGMGNSGVDAATEATHTAQQVYLSTRRGAWVYARVGTNGYPMDLWRTRLTTYLDSWRSVDYLCDKYENKTNSIFDHALYGIKPNHRIFSVHGTLSDALPNAILSGRVIIKNDVDKFEEDGIIFVGQKEVTKIDVVILATGYHIRFPFIDSNLFSAENNRVHLYKYILPPQHRTLAFIGLVQPLGAVMPISEMQCRWFIQLLLGHLKLPLIQEMERDILMKKEVMAKRYVDSIRHTIQVDFLTYLDELAEMIGVKPNLVSLALKDPKLFWACLTETVMPYQYRLVGPHSWPGARNAILSYKDRVRAPLNPQMNELSKTKSGISNFSNKLFFIVFAIVLLLIAVNIA